jgi:hypothetical protein
MLHVVLAFIYGLNARFFTQLKESARIVRQIAGDREVSNGG